MNRKYRISIAAILATVLVLTAVGAWAAPKFQGTVPDVPDVGTTATGNSTTPINLGTVNISTTCTSCTIEVEVVAPAVAAPAGKQFLGTAIDLKISGTGNTATVTFALPPAFADAGAKIYKLNTTVTPNVWEEVPAASIVTNADGSISVIGATPGQYSLIGNS